MKLAAGGLFQTIGKIIKPVFGQKASIELTFTAVNNSQIVLPNSVYVENLTQGGDTTIYTPETKLELENKHMTYSKNYPI